MVNQPENVKHIDRIDRDTPYDIAVNSAHKKSEMHLSHFRFFIFIQLIILLC